MRKGGKRIPPQANFYMMRVSRFHCIKALLISIYRFFTAKFTVIIISQPYRKKDSGKQYLSVSTFRISVWKNLLIYRIFEPLSFEKINSFLSCFPHFLKTSSERLDFTEFIFENGCCRGIFGNVSAKIKE